MQRSAELAAVRGVRQKHARVEKLTKYLNVDIFSRLICILSFSKNYLLKERICNDTISVSVTSPAL